LTSVLVIDAADLSVVNQCVRIVDFVTKIIRLNADLHFELAFSGQARRRTASWTLRRKTGEDGEALRRECLISTIFLSVGILANITIYLRRLWGAIN
jgi:hypothetical protein